MHTLRPQVVHTGNRVGRKDDHGKTSRVYTTAHENAHGAGCGVEQHYRKQRADTRPQTKERVKKMTKWKCNICPCSCFMQTFSVCTPSTCCFGDDCVRKPEWQRVDPKTQPQPAPQPELMTGIEAMFAVFKQGGGEIWREVPDEKLEHRATISANCVITKGTTLGLSETQRLYAVRPLPPETFDFAEAMARLMQGGKVRDRYGNTLWPEIIATNDNRKLFKVDLTRYSTDDQFRAVVKQS